MPGNSGSPLRRRATRFSRSSSLTDRVRYSPARSCPTVRALVAARSASPVLLMPGIVRSLAPRAGALYPAAMPRDAATLVLLVRHGRTATTGVKLPGRAGRPHLTAEGRRQADALAKHLARVPGIAAVYASPLYRARETAAPIAHALGVPLDLFQRLVVAPASVSAIAYRREGPIILTVNTVHGDLGWLGVP